MSWKPKSIPPKDELKKVLTPEQFDVTQNDGTEAPFKNKYWNEKEDGIYVDVVSGEPLFSSKDKFDSGTGWPSFDQALPGAVKLTTDNDHGMIRTEVTCANCGSHLGHVFPDGPTKTGDRYCLNSVCLELKAEEEKGK